MKTLNNVVFVTREFSNELQGGTKIRQDILKAAQSLGIHTITIPGKGVRYFFSLAALKLKHIDFIILPYPGVPTIRSGRVLDFVRNFIEIFLIGAKKLRHKHKLILYIYDLPIEQREAVMGIRPSFWDRLAEKMIFALSDIMGVVGPKMEDMIACHYPAIRNKCIYYQFSPYFAPVIKKNSKLKRPIKITFVGNLNKQRLENTVNLLVEAPEVQYIFYGPEGEWLQEKKLGFRYGGVYSPEELSRVINKECHFGLLFYDITNNSLKKYLSMTTTSKFFCYIFAGLPILSYRFDHIAGIIEKYGLGCIFDDPAEIPKILSQIDNDSYMCMTKNVANFAQYLLKENFFKQFVFNAIKTIQKEGKSL